MNVWIHEKTFKYWYEELSCFGNRQYYVYFRLSIRTAIIAKHVCLILKTPIADVNI